MITTDILTTDQSYPSVYFQLDVSLIACDEDVAEILDEILKKYSVGNLRNGNIFNIHAQKVTLDGESLVAFLAVLHDPDVQVNPEIRLHHSGDRRFKIYPKVNDDGMSSSHEKSKRMVEGKG